MGQRQVSIHVWHLEMTTRPESVPDSSKRYTLRKTETPVPELNRFLYATVGAPWKWYMRLDWSWQQWLDYLSKPGIETWIAYQGATPIGYFELEQQPLATAEIAYFGLLPEFVGQGLGGILLEDAIEKAWQPGRDRVWLHTCSLDHPNALPNYLSRGFRVFKEEDFEDSIPSGPLQPWPGANKTL